MHFYNREAAQALINKWYADNKDFLFVIDYKQEKCIVIPLGEIVPNELLYDFPNAKNYNSTIDKSTGDVKWDITPEDASSYQKKFDIVKKHLHAGNSFLTNLTCQIPIKTNLSLLDIFIRSKAMYKLWLANHFICFSPEIFVRIKNGEISSFPMKGTIDATLPKAEERLMSDKKEAAEHATIVDLIRNDLSQVAKGVKVPRYRYIDHLQTNTKDILQTSSEITGTLFNGYQNQMGDILFKLLPAGSITGAPKVMTQEIIAEAEDYERGFYTGIMGICQDGNIDSAVMIRFIEQKDDKFYFKAGGGITFQSKWEDEYQEVIQKAYVPIY